MNSNKFGTIPLRLNSKTASKSKILYKTDWSKAQVESVVGYIRRQLEQESVKDLVKEFESFEDEGYHYDDIMMFWFKWIKSNITYKSDKKNFGIAEKWEDLDILLKNKSGDCESQSSLLYCLCRHSGIPANRLMLVCGEVNDGQGHCWLEYRRGKDGNWVIMDLTWYPNYLMPEYRDLAVDDDRYVDQWFRFNETRDYKPYK